MKQSQNLTVSSVDASQGDGSQLGPKRSIIRKIGSQLPLSSAERPTFELLPNGSNVLKQSAKKPLLYSLADIILLDDTPENVRSTSIRSSASVPNLNASMQAETPVLSSVSAIDVGTAKPQDTMVTKITALEDELASLRTQIAALVTSQHNNMSAANESISSLIAAALRKKFAHRKNFESPKSDEYDNSFEPDEGKSSPFGSPLQAPQFGQHLLKRRSTSSAPVTKAKPELPSFLKKRQESLKKAAEQT